MKLRVGVAVITLIRRWLAITAVHILILVMKYVRGRASEYL